MKHPFMIGDRVYVVDVEHKLPVTFVTDELVTVRLDDGSDYSASPGKFSFSPWPKPDHQRPPGDGTYVYRDRGFANLHVGRVIGGRIRQLYRPDGVSEWVPFGDYIDLKFVTLETKIK